MNTVTFKTQPVPSFQASGNAARFAMPFAKELCTGRGLDIGYGQPEWQLPNSIGIDPKFDDRYHANKLPDSTFDYIFSSHCLEHVPDWVGTLNYWQSKLNEGGTLFLYLPHPISEYWKPWNNRKHLHLLSPELLKDYFQ